MFRASSCFALGFVVALFGCATDPAADSGGASEDEVKAAAALPDVHLFEEHDKSKIAAREGQNIVLHLPEKAGTKWDVEKSAATLDAPTRKADAGNVLFTWKTAKKVGVHVVELTAKDGSGKVTASFAFDLKVGTPSFTCPTQRSINCMPGGQRPPECAPDVRRAIQDNKCDVSFLD